jgi:hypothetical protein
MFSLKFDARGNVAVFHDTLAEIVCHIALSVCDP